MIVFSSLQIRHGTRVLLDNAKPTVNPGQNVGLVGKNVCGKSTLLALLKGEITADGGSYTFPQPLGVGLGQPGNASTGYASNRVCYRRRP